MAVGYGNTSFALNDRGYMNEYGKSGQGFLFLTIHPLCSKSFVTVCKTTIRNPVFLKKALSFH